MPSKTTKRQSANRSTKVTVPSSPLIRRQNHSRDIAGWDDPLKEERLWIVPVKSFGLKPRAHAARFETQTLKKGPHTFNCPGFYREIYERFLGKPLPSALQNIIAQEKGISANKAKQYADAILANFEFAGILKNGLVQSIGDDDDVNNDPNSDYDVPSQPESAETRMPPQPQTMSQDSCDQPFKRATLPLDETDGMVVVEWPKSISNDDFDDISDWLDILKRKIQRSIKLQANNEE